MTRTSGRSTAAALFAVLVCAALCGPAEAAKPRAKVLGAGTAVGGTLGRIRDRVSPHTAPRARAALRTARMVGTGGAFLTPRGDRVRVYLSPRFTPDPAVNQSYADLLSGLVHGPELATVTVYVAPFAEMQGICSPESDACYDPQQQVIVVAGDGPPDGTPIEDLTAHEYGHHVAQNRLDDLGPAVNWGPEYWATREGVCGRADRGTAYPGDEGSNYGLNPGEAWAETYRVLNGFSPSAWEIVDPSFLPDADALAAARRDVLTPFTGDEYTLRGGRFRARGKRWREFTVPVENDGNVDLRLTGARSLDGDLYVFADGQATRPLASARHSGRTERLTGTYCGYRHLDVAVYRYSGSGSFSLRIALPSTSPG